MSGLVVVGGGLAGAKAAEGAREAGYDGRVVIVGEEPHTPYERPPLSKDVLRGEKEPASAQVHDTEWYVSNDVEVLTGEEVTSLDLDGRKVELGGGGSLDFDHLVLATGARVRRLDVPGADLGGVHYLRTVDESLHLQDAIRKATRVAVVGASWIGSEVAASARQLGADVVLIEPLPTPLYAVLGKEVGTAFAALQADHGVELRLGTGVSALKGKDTVEAVVLSDAREEPADVVVIGVGVAPRVELAEAAGLRVDNGVLVDAELRTAVPGVFAAGDVASAWHPHYQRQVRVEHWANALNQGAHAGKNVASDPQPYDRLPYFYSDQYDLGLEYVGLAGKDDSVVIRGDLTGREFLAFYHRDGLVTAALTVNVWDVVEDLKAIITSRWVVDEKALADKDVPLASLRGVS